MSFGSKDCSRITPKAGDWELPEVEARCAGAAREGTLRLTCQREFFDAHLAPGLGQRHGTAQQKALHLVAAKLP